MKRGIDFTAVNAAALVALPALLRRWLPDGRMRGREYVARNPTRADRRPGSFRINVVSGRWADFSPAAGPGARGSDPVSLAAYLHGLSHAESARRLAAILGIRDGR